jgi:hypothetical protein
MSELSIIPIELTSLVAIICAVDARRWDGDLGEPKTRGNTVEVAGNTKNCEIPGEEATRF